MEPWEKEHLYVQRYIQGRVPSVIWGYIPMKHREAVADTAVDSDGYWIYLKRGYAAYDGADDCGIIHEYTITDLKNAIKTIEHVGCQPCR